MQQNSDASSATTRQGSDVFSALVRGFWILLLGLILGGGIGAVVSWLMPPTYQASVYMLVTPTSQNVENLRPQDYTQAYSELVTVPEVGGEAVSENGGEDPQDIERVVNVEVSPNNPLFEVIASSSDPEDASALANSIGAAVASFTEGLAEDSGYRAEVVAEATTPTRPAIPNWPLNIAVGAAAGLLMGGVAAVLWDDLVRARKRGGEQRQASDLERQAERIDNLEETLERLRASSQQDLREASQREDEAYETDQQVPERTTDEPQRGN